MRKKLPRIIAAIGVPVALVLFGIWWGYWRHFETTDDAYVKADTVTISPKVQGYVTAVPVTENQLVHKGDVIVRLEDDDFAAARDQAAAQVAAAEAQLKVLARQQTLQSALVAQAKAGITASAAKAHNDDLEYHRDQQLIGRDYVSKARVDADAAADTAANAELVKANAGLVAAQSQLAVVVAQEQQAGAALSQARAHLAAAQLDLDHTVIRAPLDGYVGNRSVQVGDYVGPGSQLFTLIPHPGLYVVANFKETQVRHMHVGQPVTISADVDTSEPLHGVIQSLAPAAGSEFSLLPPQNATGNFTKIVQRLPIRIEFTQDSSLPTNIRPGLSLVVTVDTRR